MKAAVIAGTAPRYGNWPDLEAAPGEERLQVLAAGMNHFTVMLATGQAHVPPPEQPWIPGADGVGLLADGRRVFFDSAAVPHGAWAEHTVVAAGAWVPVPAGLSDAAAASLGNAALAAYTALTSRARLASGETVLVLGATGVLGRVAVQVARALGAGRVVAAAPQSPRLHALAALGADAVVALDGPDVEQQLRAVCAGGADVVIDSLWGVPAEVALRTVAPGCRFVQVGQAAGSSLELAAGVLRSRGIDLLGHGLLRCTPQVRQRAFSELAALVLGGEVQMQYEVVPLAEVASAWERQANGPRTKLVLVP